MNTLGLNMEVKHLQYVQYMTPYYVRHDLGKSGRNTVIWVDVVELLCCVEC